MDINIFKILTGIALICVSNISLAEFNNNLIVKSGIFTLKYTDQTIQEPVTYVPDSKNFFAIEFEWKRNEKNISPGIEFIKFKNDYAATTDDDMASYLLFFNLRKYIGKMKRVQPFVGAGFGYGVIDSKFTPIPGNYFQLIAGFKFQFDKVNALIEYKKLIDTGLDNGIDTKYWNTNPSIKYKRPVISAEGLFFGVGMSF